MIQESTLKFLKALNKNNNKPWFDAHRDQYEHAKTDFGTFIQAVIDKHGANDKSIANLTSKECMFRINRDVRFSKDKSPYKTNFGASINKGGKKSTLAGYYFHLQPGEAFVGGGMYVPPADELRKVRQEIDYNYDEFKKLVLDKRFKKIYGDLDHSKEYALSRVPKGYEADNPAAGYLKLKSLIAFQPLSDEELTSKSLVKKTLAAFEALQPLLNFLNAAVE